MITNLNKYKKDILFLPLGGSGEIGLNCNLYHYNGKWIVVDIGIGFVNNIPGVDVIIPDINFIKNNKKDFLGIFLTHIHDDHIGATQHIWEELELPIYGSKFTINFLKERLREYQYFDKVQFVEVSNNKKIILKPFELEFINLTHSTIEMNAILIKTEKGNILHTGDWKFEEKPFIGDVSNKKKLKDLGNKKDILAVVCESTNIFKTAETKTEIELSKNLVKVIKEHKKGLIVCTLFASNISRVIMLALAGKSNKRKIGIIGRSLYRILKVANEMKLLPSGIEFIPEEDFKKYDKNELLILATGCQGEITSGLNKLANNLYKNITLSNGDTVIFSSSIIPGNEKNIYNLYNKLSERDVKIITAENNFVHLSGHYNINDLKEFYNLVKPKIVITTHGEQMHLTEHKRVVNEIGIKNVIKAKNGNLIKINSKNPEKTEIIQELKLTNIAIDGKRKIPLNSHILAERQKIADAGIIIIFLLVDKNYKLKKQPNITTVGNYDLGQEKGMFEIFKEDITKTYENSLKKVILEENSSIFDTCEKKEIFINREIHKVINKTFQSDMGKKPFVVIKICKI